MNSGSLIAILTVIAVMQSVTPVIADTVTHFEYSNHDQPVRIWIEDESNTKFQDTMTTYDEAGHQRIVRRRATFGTDDNTHDEVTETIYTVTGLVASINRTGPNSTTASTINTYDKLGRVINVDAPEGQETQYVYDASGNIQFTKVRFDAGANDFLVTEVQYDALNRPVKVIDPDLHYVITAYDSQSRPRETIAYDSTDAKLVRRTFVYDKAGRTIQTARFADAASTASSPNTALDQVTDTTYDADGRSLTSTTYGSTGSSVTTSTYDAIGRSETHTDPEGNSTQWVYKANGLLNQRIVDDFGSETPRTFNHFYDDAYRLSEQREGTSQTRSTFYAYDTLDRRTSMTDAEGVESQTVFDLLGRQVREIEAVGTSFERITDSIFDRLGRMIGLAAYEVAADVPTSPPLDWASATTGQLTRYTYDLANRRTMIAYPDNTATNPTTDIVSIVYDNASRPTQKTDQRGIITDFTYNGRGLVLTKTAGLNKTTFHYDGIGRLTQADNGLTTNPNYFSKTEFIYNDLSQLTQEKQTNGNTLGLVLGVKTLDYEYDPSGNRTLVEYPLDVGVELMMTIDKLGRTTDILSTVSGTTNGLVEYQYEGQFVAKRRVKTDATSPTWIETTFGHDVFRRTDLIANEVNSDDPRLLAGFEFDFDDVGNRLATYGAGNPKADQDIIFAYDNLNRLNAANYPDGTELFNYDLLGNRDGDGVGTNGYGYLDSRPGGVDKTYGANNAANEYSTVAGNAVEYDAAGNLIFDEHGIAYEYNENNLIRFIYDENGASIDGYDLGTDTLYVEFTYDALGRRIYKRDYSIGDGFGVITLFVYDGQNVIAEYDLSAATSYSPVLVRDYLHGSTYIDERIATRDLASAGDPAYYYLLKELYSVAGLTDNTGTMVEAYAYDAYGKVTPYSVQMVNCDVTGDADDDCDVDLADFELFQLCYHPTGGIPAGCPSSVEAKLDLDNDNDVDLTDLAAFASAGTGPTGDFLATGDWDDSGTVDTTDAEAFVSTCYSGAGTSISSNGCRVFDFDGDGDVDIGDYGALLSLLGTSTSTNNEFQLTAIDRSTKNPYFFTGRRLDWIDYGETELNQHYHYRARDYDGERFLQRDPIRYIDSYNAYQYVRGRPTVFVDPTGRYASSGTWKGRLGATSDRYWSSTTQASFIPSKALLNSCCSKIGIVQIARTVYTISGWRIGLDNNEWHIDGLDDPYFSPVRWKRKHGTKHPPEHRDEPGAGIESFVGESGEQPTHLYQHFETCAVCTEGCYLNRKILSCYRWGHSYRRNSVKRDKNGKIVSARFTITRYASIGRSESGKVGQGDQQRLDLLPNKRVKEPAWIIEGPGHGPSKNFRKLVAPKLKPCPKSNSKNGAP
jgi:RHS repeat-associated protein